MGLQSIRDFYKKRDRMEKGQLTAALISCRLILHDGIWESLNKAHQLTVSMTLCDVFCLCHWIENI